MSRAGDGLQVVALAFVQHEVVPRFLDTVPFSSLFISASSCSVETDSNADDLAPKS